MPLGQGKLPDAEIAAGIQAVESGGIDRVIAVAASSADLPPALDDADPITWWVGEQHAKWEGVCAWFVADRAGSPATVERLANFAVGAVVSLTRTLGRLNDRRTRPVDRAADFRALARWFAECRTDSSAHVLWQTAFGLYSARHFHLEEKDAELTNPGESWWSARLTQASGTAEREACLEMLEDAGANGRIILGGDKNYDTHDFVETLRSLNVTPHVAHPETHGTDVWPKLFHPQQTTPPSATAQVWRNPADT